MLSTVDTSKSAPLGLFHTPIYMQLAVHLHHKKESLAEVLSHGNPDAWVGQCSTAAQHCMDCPSRWPDAAQMCTVGGLTAQWDKFWSQGDSLQVTAWYLLTHSDCCWSMVIHQRKRIIFHWLISMEIMRNHLQKLDFLTISTWRFDSFLLLIFLFSILNVA